MQNFLLQSYCIQLYDALAKFLYTEKKNYRLAVIENCKNTNRLQIINFIRAGKKYSLPFVVFNKEFQIITKENIENSCPAACNSFDAVLSLFNLHSLPQEEQVNFIKRMQKLAQRAIFVDYENPERNLAYAGYFLFLVSQYVTYVLEKMFTAQKTSLSCFRKYCKNGALEGFLYEIPHFLPESSIKFLERKHYGLGGIGMAYLQW